MRKLIAVLIIYLSVTGVTLAGCPSIKVSGAGFEAVNGMYKCNGVYNGKWFWNLEGYPVVYWKHAIYWSPNYGGGWAISDSPFVIYFGYGDTKIPSQVNSKDWFESMLYVSPVPTVTLAN